jgi:hypothetical protein
LGKKQKPRRKHIASGGALCVITFVVAAVNYDALILKIRSALPYAIFARPVSVRMAFSMKATDGAVG